MTLPVAFHPDAQAEFTHFSAAEPFVGVEPPEFDPDEAPRAPLGAVEPLDPAPEPEA